MRKLILILLLLPVVAWSEPFEIDYTEPATQAGALARTCVYWCACLKSDTCACTNWKREVCIDAGDGNGGVARNVIWNVPIYEDDLPVTVRYSVTSVNDDGNETTRGDVAGTHPFPVPAP